MGCCPWEQDGCEQDRERIPGDTEAAARLPIREGVRGVVPREPSERNTDPTSAGPSGLADVWKRDAAFTNGGLSNFAGRPASVRSSWDGLRCTSSCCTPPMRKPTSTRCASARGPSGRRWDGAPTAKAQTLRRTAETPLTCVANWGWRDGRRTGEAWAEAQYSWKTVTFINGWRSGGSPCPLGWSVLSSDTANFAVLRLQQRPLDRRCRIDLQVRRHLSHLHRPGRIGDADQGRAAVPRWTNSDDLRHQRRGHRPVS